MSPECTLPAPDDPREREIFVPQDVRPIDVPRAARTLLNQLAALPALTSTVSDVLDGLAHPMVVSADVLQPRLAATCVVGHAVTLRYLPERRSAALPTDRSTPGRLGHLAAFATASPGDVVVIDACSAPGASACGGLGALAAQRAGIGGLIVDGAIRDVDEYRAIAFPAWSRSVTPRTGKWRIEAVAINAPISCAGQQVQAGDLVLADDNGVCFVPPELINYVIAAVLETAAREGRAFHDELNGP